jgi:hypothetical protein
MMKAGRNMMFGKCAVLLLVTGVLLSGCKHENNTNAMQVSLNTIRVMVKQSALLAVQAACAPQDTRHDMIQASVTLLRRAMGGPEMEKVHQMMGQMPDMASGSMSKMNGKSDQPGSPEMKLHVAIHNTGEDVFDFLDALGGANAPTCADVQPAALAAAAAVIREQHGTELDQAVQQLDKESGRLAQGKTPDVVHQLALSLAQI